MAIEEPTIRKQDNIEEQDKIIEEITKELDTTKVEIEDKPGFFERLKIKRQMKKLGKTLKKTDNLKDADRKAIIEGIIGLTEFLDITNDKGNIITTTDLEEKDDDFLIEVYTEGLKALEKLL